MSLIICPTCYKMKNMNDEWIDMDIDPDEVSDQAEFERCPDHRHEIRIASVERADKSMIGDDHTVWSEII